MIRYAQTRYWLMNETVLSKNYQPSTFGMNFLRSFRKRIKIFKSCEGCYQLHLTYNFNEKTHFIITFFVFAKNKCVKRKSRHRREKYNYSFPSYETCRHCISSIIILKWDYTWVIYRVSQAQKRSSCLFISSPSLS